MSDPTSHSARPEPASAHTAEQIAAVQKRSMRVLIAMQIAGTVGVGVAPSIGVLLVGEVTDNEALAGLARTASTLGAALVGLPLGTLAAGSGRRVALASGWWAAAVGAALLVAAAQWSLLIPLLIGLLLIGVGSAASLQARFAATDLAEPAHRGRSLSLVVWVGTLGAVLGPNLGVPGQWINQVTGLTVFAGAFLITAICLGIAGALVFLLLRPDPLKVLQEVTAEAAAGEPAGPEGGRIRQVMAELRVNRQARYALVAILTAQVVMVSIMTMTPVHITHHGGSVTLVGITISLHVLGMYALSPLVGMMVDRAGHRLTITLGMAVFLASLLFGIVIPESTTGVIAALVLLGVGWSLTNIAGSTLFSAVISDKTRAASQGTVDSSANLLGAVAAFASGPLLAVSSFATLNVVAVAVLVPLAVLTIRR